MAGLTRTVHPQANIKWAPLGQVCPDVQIDVKPVNGSEPEQPMALMFVDPDGETHVYLFNEDGRQGLIRQLTSGVVLPPRV